jgi:hypothetical protein
MTVTPVAPAMACQDERNLVLLCARLKLEGAARERVRELLKEPLLWDGVMEWAGYHHGTALLHHHLSQPDMHGVPDAVRSDLRARYHAIAARNLKLSNELAELLEELEAVDAPGVLWKGPVLAHSVYPSPELRTFGDLDLILRLEDRERARQVFERRGYGVLSGIEPVRRADIQREPWKTPLEFQDLRCRGSPLGCDARVRFCSYRLPELVGTERAYGPPGKDGQGSSPGFHFLALCVHGAKHGPFPWPALKWVTDMEAFLETMSWDWWLQVLHLARRLGCHRMALLGVSLAHELLEAPLPPAVAEEVRKDPVIASLIPPIRARILDPTGRRFPFAERIAFGLAVRERSRDRMWFARKRLMDFGFQTKGIPRRLLRFGSKYLSRPGALRTLLRGTHPKGSGEGP